MDWTRLCAPSESGYPPKGAFESCLPCAALIPMFILSAMSVAGTECCEVGKQRWFDGQGW